MELSEATEKRRTIRDFDDRPIDTLFIKKIIAAGLKTFTDNRLRQWDSVLVNNRRERSKVLNLKDMTSDEMCEKMMAAYNMTDSAPRNKYHIAMPCYTALGYPAKTAKVPVQKVIRGEDRIHFNRRERRHSLENAS